MDDDPRSPFAEAPTTAAPLPPVRPRPGGTPRRPSAFAAVGWNDLRVKGWAAVLTLATAYVATKPEKYAWLAPVLTAWAAASKPPSVRAPEAPQ